MHLQTGISIKICERRWHVDEKGICYYSFNAFLLDVIACSCWLQEGGRAEAGWDHSSGSRTCTCSGPWGSSRSARGSCNKVGSLTLRKKRPASACGRFFCLNTFFYVKIIFDGNGRIVVW